ncbi:MAG: homoserine kinase [Myxococcales bacterium]|nr:homoserine kinase [Myxococcales bacterium]
MALLTPMTLVEAQALGALFGLEVVALRPIAAGSVNSNFGLECVRGDPAFLRVFEESDAPAVERQNALLAWLGARGVATPAPLARADGAGTVATHRGKPVSVFPFLPGEHLCQRRLRPAHLARLGEALARVHLAGEGYAPPPPNRFGARELGLRLADLHARRSELPADVAALLPELESRLAELGPLDLGGATTVVHGDVFRDNVLWRDDELVAILDFESASAGSPAFDLMVTMLAWSFGDALDRSLAAALLAGYLRVRDLGPVMRAALYDAARFAALRFAVTRITDYELRPRGVVVYKDYRRFVARLCAVEAIGRGDFAEWLQAS